MMKLLTLGELKADGEYLKAGEIVQIIHIERGTEDKPYYRFNYNRNIGEWLNESDLKKQSLSGQEALLTSLFFKQ